VDPLELATALKGLQEWAEANAPGRDSVLRRRIAEHLGGDPTVLPVVGEQLGEWERPNLQLALDAWGGGAGRALGVIGLSSMHGYRESIAELVQPESQGPPALPGPVEYTTVTVADRKIVCVASGLVLLRGPAGPAVALLRTDDHGMGSSLSLELMAPERAQAEALLAELQELMAEHNVFRGRVVQVSQSMHGGLTVEVRILAEIARERIVLPPGVLERIERHTIEFGRHAERLRAAGRHLKRGAPAPRAARHWQDAHRDVPRRTCPSGPWCSSPAGDSRRSARRSTWPARSNRRWWCSRTSISWRWTVPTTTPTHSCSSCSTRWTGWRRMLTWSSCSPRIDLRASRPRWRDGPGASTRRSSSRSRTRMAGGDSSTSTPRAWTSGRPISPPSCAGRRVRAPRSSGKLARRGALLAVEEGGEGAVVVEERHLVAALDELQSDRERLTGALLGADAAAGTPPPSVPPPSVAAENAVELVDEEDDGEGWTAYGPTELR